MLREKERKVLENIFFVERYISLINKSLSPTSQNCKIDEKRIVAILAKKNIEFSKQNKIIIEKFVANYTFRLILDVKFSILLPYIFVLKNGVFLDNGLSHFGYLLNYFDLTNYEITKNKHFIEVENFEFYLDGILLIYDDFIKEYTLEN